VEIQRVDSAGRGVGTLPDGKVVFVPRTAPGDRVQVEISKDKPRWAEGKALRWLQEGPSRRIPPCPRFSECDGCALQHLDYAEQLVWKGRSVGDALRRLAGLEVDDPEVVPSPSELRYRNKMTFTLRRLGGGRLVAGLREFGRPSRVLDLGPECLLPEEHLSRLWGELREGWGPEATLLPAGKELRLTLQGAASGAGLLIRGGEGDGDPDTLLTRIPGLSSIWREERGRFPRRLAGLPAVAVEWEGGRIPITAGGFVQVNRGAGEALYHYVIQEAGALEGRRVVDAYCGQGLLGRSLAEAGADVVGIDIAPPAVMDTPLPSLGSLEMVGGTVEEELEGLLPADLVILNPPRAGLDESVPTILRTHQVERIVYVSCDPATLARDLRRLGDSFRLSRIRGFDLFPQTGHVETVVSLVGTNR
jgi:23S rRNA (uracil1939-C5)-methyltransferase